jgi:hypothetical protein
MRCLSGLMRHRASKEESGLRIGHAPLGRKSFRKRKSPMPPLPDGRGSVPGRSRDREEVAMARLATYVDESCRSVVGRTSVCRPASAGLSGEACGAEAPRRLKACPTTQDVTFARAEVSRSFSQKAPGNPAPNRRDLRPDGKSCSSPYSGKSKTSFPTPSA